MNKFQIVSLILIAVFFPVILHPAFLPLQLETAHCIVYYDNNFELAAQTALEAAEDAIADCSDLSASRLSSRVSLRLCKAAKYPFKIDADGTIHLYYNGNRSDLSVAAYHAVAIVFMDRFFSEKGSHPETIRQHRSSSAIAAYLAGRSAKYRYPHLIINDDIFKNKGSGSAILQYIEDHYGFEKNRAFIHHLKNGHSPKSAYYRLFSARLPNIGDQTSASARTSYSLKKEAINLFLESRLNGTVLEINANRVLVPASLETDLSRSVSISDSGNIVYVWFSSSQSGIRIYDSRGLLVHNAVLHFLSLSYPVLSGEYLYFCAGLNKGSDIMRYRLSDGEIIALTDTIESEYHLRYDASSEVLLYCAGDCGEYSIREISANGLRTIASIIAPGPIGIDSSAVSVSGKIPDDHNPLPEIPDEPLDYAKTRTRNSNLVPRIMSLSLTSAMHMNDYSSHINTNVINDGYALYSLSAGIAMHNIQAAPFVDAHIRLLDHSFPFINVSHYSLRDPQIDKTVLFSDPSANSNATDCTVAYEWHPFNTRLFALIPKGTYSWSSDHSATLMLSPAFRAGNSSTSALFFEGYSINVEPSFIHSGNADTFVAITSEAAFGAEFLPLFFWALSGGYATMNSHTTTATSPRFIPPRKNFAEYIDGSNLAWGKGSLVIAGKTRYPLGLKPALRGSAAAAAAWDKHYVHRVDERYRDFSASFSGGFVLMRNSLFLSLDAICPWRYKHMGYPDILFSLNMEL